MSVFGLNIWLLKTLASASAPSLRSRRRSYLKYLDLKILPGIPAALLSGQIFVRGIPVLKTVPLLKTLLQIPTSNLYQLKWRLLREIEILNFFKYDLIRLWHTLKWHRRAPARLPSHCSSFEYRNSTFWIRSISTGSCFYIYAKHSKRWSSFPLLGDTFHHCFIIDVRIKKSSNDWELGTPEEVAIFNENPRVPVVISGGAG